MSADCPAVLIPGGVCTCGQHTRLAPVLADEIGPMPMPVLLEVSAFTPWVATLCKSCGYDITQRHCPLCSDTQDIVDAIGLIEQAHSGCAGLTELRAIVARRVK